MLRLIIFLFLFSPVQAGFAQSSNAARAAFCNPLLKEQLKGRVKQIKEYRYIAKKADEKSQLKADSSTLTLRIMNFDAAGNLLLDSTGSAVTRYKYSKNGQLTEKSTSLEGKITGVWSYRLDDKGFVNQESVFTPGKTVPKQTLNRNYTEAGPLVYSYKLLNEEDRVNGCRQCIFNKSGHITMSTDGCDSTFAAIEKYFYSPTGNVLRYEHYNFPGKLSSHTEYDAKGNIISETCDECAEDAYGRVKTFEYVSFDAAGNWTKQLKITNGNRYRVNVIERKIKYQ